MQVTLNVGAVNTVVFEPLSVYEEIMQNLRTILATPKFSVPLDRDFGVNADYLDMPVMTAKALIAADIINAIRKCEPRVTVESIDWDEDAEALDGILKPKVQVIINESE